MPVRTVWLMPGNAYAAYRATDRWMRSRTATPTPCWSNLGSATVNEWFAAPPGAPGSFVISRLTSPCNRFRRINASLRHFGSRWARRVGRPRRGRAQLCESEIRSSTPMLFGASRDTASIETRADVVLAGPRIPAQHDWVRVVWPHVTMTGWMAPAGGYFWPHLVTRRARWSGWSREWSVGSCSGGPPQGSPKLRRPIRTKRLR